MVGVDQPEVLDAGGSVEALVDSPGAVGVTPVEAVVDHPHGA
jgi:hypothetical protein